MYGRKGKKDAQRGATATPPVKKKNKKSESQSRGLVWVLPAWFICTQPCPHEPFFYIRDDFGWVSPAGVGARKNRPLPQPHTHFEPDLLGLT